MVSRPLAWHDGRLAPTAGRILGLLLVVWAVLLGGGCEYVAITDDQLVKNRIREHAEAITAAMESRDWNALVPFYDLDTFRWQQDRPVTTPQELQELQALSKAQPGAVVWKTPQQVTVTLQGGAAAKGFLGTLHAIHNMDEFFTIVNSASRVKPDVIEAKVTMQAHIVLSSTEMNYTNRFWDARMGWVKRGPGDWRIHYIIETTARQEGKFSRI